MFSVSIKAPLVFSKLISPDFQRAKCGLCVQYIVPTKSRHRERCTYDANATAVLKLPQKHFIFNRDLNFQVAHIPLYVCMFSLSPKFVFWTLNNYFSLVLFACLCDSSECWVREKVLHEMLLFSTFCVYLCWHFDLTIFSFYFIRITEL